MSKTANQATGRFVIEETRLERMHMGRSTGQYSAGYRILDTWNGQRVELFMSKAKAMKAVKVFNAGDRLPMKYLQAGGDPFAEVS